MLEDSDLKDLLKPEESIIDLGGEIFFALANGIVIGTAAMIPFPNSKIELAKMTVQKEYRGKGLSKNYWKNVLTMRKHLKQKKYF